MWLLLLLLWGAALLVVLTEAPATEPGCATRPPRLTTTVITRTIHRLLLFDSTGPGVAAHAAGLGHRPRPS